jgi:hypothetical protein
MYLRHIPNTQFALTSFTFVILILSAVTDDGTIYGLNTLISLLRSISGGQPGMGGAGSSGGADKICARD